MRIYKLILSNRNCRDDFVIEKDAKILSTGLDPNGNLCIWYSTNGESKIYRTITVVGTGLEFQEDTFIGTVIEGNFVWHVFIK